MDESSHKMDALMDSLYYSNEDLMYKGTVRKIGKNTWQGKDLHSFQLNGDDTYYNTGTDNPNVAEGDQIVFDGVPGKRAGTVNVKTKSISKSTEPPFTPDSHSMVSQPGAERAKRVASVVTKDDYWAAREARDEVTQKRIEIQAARNAAIALLDTGLDTTPFDSLTEAVNFWTDVFLDDNEKRLG